MLNGYCPYCGTPVVSNAKYCTACGKTLPDIGAQSQREGPPPEGLHGDVPGGFSAPSAIPDYLGPSHGKDPARLTHLAIPFDVPPLGGTATIVSNSLRLFVENLGMIAKITLVVFAPLEILKNWAFYRAGAAENFSLIFRVDMLLEGIFGSLVVPTLIYALITRRGTGQAPGLGESYQWGRRQWARTFGNRWLASMATLGGLILFIIPGIIFWTWFSLVDLVVAIEADNQPKALTRSRTLTEGHRWTIFGAFVLTLLLLFVVGALCGNSLAFVDNWVISAIMDCLLGVASRVVTVLALVIYLGIAHQRAGTASLSEPAPAHVA